MQDYDFNREFKGTAPRVKPIDELAESFCQWSLSFDNATLYDWVAWSAWGTDGDYIKNYQDFLQLVQALEKKGYKTSSPPNEQDFNVAVDKREEIRKEEGKENAAILQLERAVKNHEDHLLNGKPIESIDELAEWFRFWREYYKHPEGTDNSHLCSWIFDNYRDSIRIKNYQDFCQLAQALEKKGYKTNPPPSEEDFNAAIDERERVILYIKKCKYEREYFNNNEEKKYQPVKKENSNSNSDDENYPAFMEEGMDDLTISFLCFREQAKSPCGTKKKEDSCDTAKETHSDKKNPYRPKNRASC